MTTPHRRVLAAATVAFAMALAACGEREQVIVYKQGKYQGKPDTKPWDSGPGNSLYTTSKWSQGDRTSWESALRTRNLAQNEYNRVE
jgi:hypothetical protein